MSDSPAREIDWQDIEARFVPPAELQQPLPRRVVPRDGEDMSCRGRAERGCLGGCLVPIFLLGVLLMFWAGLAALMLPLGSTTTGTITARERGDNRDKTNFLRFRFRVGDRTYEAQGQVPTEKWRLAKRGDAVRVRYFPFAPELRPLLADDFSPWASILGLGILGLLLVGIAGLPLTGLFSQWRGRRLVRYGLVAPALVVGHDRDKNQVIVLVRDQDGRTLELRQRLRAGSIFRKDLPEAALYFPGRPQDAQLYECLDWKAHRNRTQ